MTPLSNPSIDAGRLIMGFNVMLVGVLGWLWQAGHLSGTQLLGFWPLALVGIGLAGLLDPKRKPEERRGWGLVLAGVVLILGNLLLPDQYTIEIRLLVFPLRLSIPLLLVLGGVYMIWRDRHPAKKRRSCACGTEDCRC